MQISSLPTTDVCTLRQLLIGAFGGPDEYELVQALHASDEVIASLAAHDADGVAGYVLFFRLKAQIDGREVAAAGLAPLAVREDCRRLGIGASLVSAGLAECRAGQAAFAVVQGDPGYYGRCGFSVAAAAGLCSAFSGPYLQALELVPGGLGSGAGELIYPAAFDRFVL